MSIASSSWLCSIITSIVAAFIFWLAFDYSPKKSRRNSIRPILTFKLEILRMRIINIFEECMCSKQGSIGHFKDDIISGKMTFKMIQSGLSDKCMNESYIHTSELSYFLSPKGYSFRKKLLIITKNLDSILHFSEQLTTQEIIALDKIKIAIENLPFQDDEAYYSKPDNHERYCFPSLNKYSKDFFIFYKAFTHLQNLIFAAGDYSNKTRIDKLIFLYNTGDFQQCINEARKILWVSRDFDESLQAREYIALCLYSIDPESEKTYKYVAEAIKADKNKTRLISRFKFINILLKNDKHKKHLERYYDDSDFSYLHEIASKEDEERKSILKNIEKLKEASPSLNSYSINN